MERVPKASVGLTTGISWKVLELGGAFGECAKLGYI